MKFSTLIVCSKRCIRLFEFEFEFGVFRGYLRGILGYLRYFRIIYNYTLI